MTAPDGTVTIRLIMPDRWLEHVAELPRELSVSEAKVFGMREMLQRSSDDPKDFYTEYQEREVIDETQSLEQLGIRPRGVLSIRAYDLGHYPRFNG